MNKFRSAALGLAILAGSAATAAAQSTTTPNRTPAAAGERQGRGPYGTSGRMGGRRMGKPRMGGCRMGGRRTGERMEAGLFDGIDLSADQKARIQTIRDRYRAEGDSLRDVARPDMEAARNARRNGDSTAARASFDRTAAVREKMRALHERQASEVRGVLTADQQRKYDANLAELKTRRQEKGKDGAGKRRKQA